MSARRRGGARKATPPRARRRKKAPAARFVVAALVAAALVALGWYLAGRHLELPPSASNPRAEAPPEAAAAARKSPPARPAKPLGPARVAIVIDDLGRSLADLDRLAALGVPLSYAVLPYESMTERVVARLRERGAELLCHLPMEAKGADDPGQGALLSGQAPAELAAATARALDSVPGAVGANNHMGSRLSEDEGSMRAILEVVAARRLFFLDSRTSGESIAYRVARELGVPAARRKVFLDGRIEEAEITARFAELLATARRDGAAIGIGHPHPATLAVLARELPKAVAAGFELVPVSFLLDRGEELPE